MKLPNDCENIFDIREAIDSIDKEIIDLIGKRAGYVHSAVANSDKWNHASDDWHAPRAVNDLSVGGKFNIRMEAKDGSAGFDFRGVYDEVDRNEKIAYTIADGRKVEVLFSGDGNETKIVTAFEAEFTNPIEMQKAGWQAILDNFKNYAESYD